MAQVYLSLGSNIDRRKHLRAALDDLFKRFGSLQVSTVYESEAIGFEGDPFFNLAVGIKSDLPLGMLGKELRSIEDRNGRRRDTPKFSARTLDIDILTYDDLMGVIEGVELPRPELVKNAFVLRPVADIATHVVHPFYGKSFGELWAEYDQTKQKLWPVEFNWQAPIVCS